MEGTAAAGARALRALRGQPARRAEAPARGARGAAPVVEPLADLRAAEPDWTALAERSGNVFATWEWADVWWRHFGDGLRQAIGLVRDGEGAPLALVPLCVRGRRPLRLARFIGYGPADQLGPVCATEAMPAAFAALERQDWDSLLAERLPPGHGLRGRSLRHESSPVIAVPEGGWEEYLAGRSRNLRSQLRRKERALERDHGLAFRLCDDPARVGDDMETLLRLHHKRWEEQGSGALESRRAAFHRDFAAVALERGWLRLWVAEAEGEPVAAWYGFRFGDAEYYYQSGRDPTWDRASVGLVLLAHTVREAMADGMREYRLLRGAEAYKDRFSTDDEGLETVAAGRGAALGAVVSRLPGRVRRRVFS